MQFESRQEGQVVVLEIHDRALDAHNAADFRAQVDRLIAEGHERVVLDMSRIDFLDSTGLGAVVTGLKRMRGHGELVLCGIVEVVMNVFRLTRMDRVFRIEPDVDTAVAALSSQPEPVGTEAR